MNKFGLETTKHMRTPMGTNVKLTKVENGSSVHLTLYRNMIDNLLYLTASRLDIYYSVEMCARYQDLKESHLAAVKIIIHFVNETVDFVFGIQRILI